jgi:hypothetical protein
MVSLGFVKDVSQCPAGTPRVVLGRAAQGGPALRAWRERRRQSVELRWNVAWGSDLGLWAGDMAQALADLRWPAWCIDAQAVADATDAPAGQRLTAWGLAFWAHYRSGADVYLAIGEDGRRAAMRSVDAWTRGFAHVTFAQRLDIDLQVRQKAEEYKDKPVRRTLNRLFPALFNRH